MSTTGRTIWSVKKLTKYQIQQCTFCVSAHLQDHSCSSVSPSSGDGGVLKGCRISGSFNIDGSKMRRAVFQVALLPPSQQLSQRLVDTTATVSTAASFSMSHVSKPGSRDYDAHIKDRCVCCHPRAFLQSYCLAKEDGVGGWTTPSPHPY